MGLIPLSGLLKTAAAGFEGYGDDKATAVKNELARIQQERADRTAAVEERVKLAGINPVLQGQLAGARVEGETPGLVLRADQLRPGEVQKATDIARSAGDVARQTHAADRQYDVTHPLPVPSSFSPIVTTAGDGKQHVSILNTKTGELKDTGTEAKAAPAGGSGNLARGFGQGGPLGAASGLASVKEMHAAHPNLQTFEKGLMGDIPVTQLNALDRFRQRLANDLQTHGAITAAQATEAERELAATNPDLAIYGRNLQQWIVSDMNLSRGGTDERARKDAAVSGLSIPLSSMSPAQRSMYINQIWEGRQARLSGLDLAVPGMEAMLKRLAGNTGDKAPLSLDVAGHDAEFEALLASLKPKKP